MADKLIVYTDGGSRGNPGPAAIGVVFKQSAKGKELPYKEYAQSIGKATNNEAEYRAVIFAMKKAKALLGKKNTKNMELEIRLDSELVARQLRGDYKTEEESLWPYFMKVWNLRQDYALVIFKEIPREKNKEADRLLNQELDKQGLF
jgi:ribonuclease HI